MLKSFLTSVLNEKESWAAWAGAWEAYGLNF